MAECALSKQVGYVAICATEVQRKFIEQRLRKHMLMEMASQGTRNYNVAYGKVVSDAAEGALATTFTPKPVTPTKPTWGGSDGKFDGKHNHRRRRSDNDGNHADGKHNHGKHNDGKHTAGDCRRGRLAVEPCGDVGRCSGEFVTPIKEQCCDFD